MRRSNQEEGVDSFGMYAPIPGASSTPLLAVVAVRNGIQLSHLDSQQSFIQAPLNKEVNIELRHGYGQFSGNIARSNKSLYDLRRARHESDKILTAEPIGCRIHRYQARGSHGEVTRTVSWIVPSVPTLCFLP